MLGLCPKSGNKVFIRNLVRRLVTKVSCEKRARRSSLLSQDLSSFVSQKFRANGVECQLCQAGINDIRNTLRDVSIQKQIQNFLKDEVCTKLGSLEITVSSS